MVKSIKLIPHWPFDARIYGDLHWQGCCWLEESHTNGAMHWQKPRMSEGRGCLKNAGDCKTAMRYRILGTTERISIRIKDWWFLTSDIWPPPFPGMRPLLSLFPPRNASRTRPSCGCCRPRRCRRRRCASCRFRRLRRARLMHVKPV